ncbi:histidine phosphatase family protein [Nodosilinea sp. LEGE 06152]|uniref:histidine phosphatase family protein n=1 Tax=Nodosilinea sp. LEGE 06152 TaxID=2777966 RepID=UPI00187F440F|nr:histidine phosphatase family protein [Nodosilinea sp. LEGE 06152]
MLRPLKNKPLPWSLWWRAGLLGLALTGCSASQRDRNALIPIAPALALPTLTQAAPADLALSPAAPRSAPVTLWDHLQRADEQLYVVLLRHAIAPGTGDPANFRLDDCATQRNLSAVGRSQAQQIGAAFRQRNIAVAQVLSSQWCRCLETAELMDLGPVEPYPPLNSFFRDRSTAASQTAQVQAYVRNQPNQGVLVMVTHQVNITALTGVVPGSGQAVVMALNEVGDLAQVGLLDAGQ